MQESFDLLIRDWNHGVSANDILHNVFTWIYKYKSCIVEKKVLQEIGLFEDLMNSNTSANDILEQFFQGKEFQQLRQFMGYPV